MRFKCRKSWAELTAESVALEEWHDCFAWWPKRVNETQCVWLEFIERRYPNAFASSYRRKVVRLTPVYRLKE